MLWTNPSVPLTLPVEAARAYDLLAGLKPLDHYVEKQGRSTGRYRLAGARGDATVFLKKYLRLPWWLRWFAPLASFPGLLEWTHLSRVERLGIVVPEVIVAGAARGHACGSFLAVRELTGFVPLHEFIPAHFGLGKTALIRKRDLCRRLADVARRLHEARLYHRDFYLCHFFVRPAAEAADGFELALIDFLRLKPSHRVRWRIKDLAQLSFSADLPGITRADRLRFLKHYLGINRLDNATRRLIRRVERKADRYRRHNAT
jgi:lipopolysaccharide kinase (Kdo/WaaP) family protein